MGLKRIIYSGVLSCFCMLMPFAAEADETLTITTYYPSPYGSYNELTARRMKIGTNYSGSGTTVANDNLIIEGKVGIGTPVTNLFSGTLKLDVEGDVGAQHYCDNTGQNCYTVTDLKGLKIGDTITPAAGDCSGVSVPISSIGLHPVGADTKLTIKYYKEVDEGTCLYWGWTCDGNPHQIRAYTMYYYGSWSVCYNQLLYNCSTCSGISNPQGGPGF